MNDKSMNDDIIETSHQKVEVTCPFLYPSTFFALTPPHLVNMDTMKESS